MDALQALDPLPRNHHSFFVSAPARTMLAVLLLGAGTIHLVMVPAHAGEWLPEGLAFAFAGWVQLGLAAAIIAKPDRRWLDLALLANLLFIAAWAVTRTTGLPFGPNAGHTEAAALVDLACVGLEAATILLVGVLLKHPRLGEHLDSGALVMASIVPVGVMMLTTAVLASPNARTHVHGADSETAAHDHATGVLAAGAAGADGHEHAGDTAAHDHAGAPAVPASQRCDWGFNTVAFWSQNPAAVDDGTHAHAHGAPAESANPDATVGNQSGLQVWKPMTDMATCTQLKADLTTMESMAKTYPTAQDALNAGCVKITGYVPGIAAHYGCLRSFVDGKLDIDKPEMLLYGGNETWAPLVGLSYYSTSKAPPAGEWVFGQMPFHVHEGLCLKGTLVIGGDGSNKAECEAAGGRVMGTTGFMGHYWLPACSSPDGVFSDANPRLDPGVATYNDDPKFNPALGGDPTQLRADPCRGSKVANNSRFGAPSTATAK